MSIVTAHSAMDFLTGSSTLLAIGNKYSRGLSEHYEPVNPQLIAGIAEEKLRTLSEIEAAENAVIILNAYIYRRFKFILCFGNILEHNSTVMFHKSLF